MQKKKKKANPNCLRDVESQRAITPISSIKGITGESSFVLPQTTIMTKKKPKWKKVENYYFLTKKMTCRDILSIMKLI